MKTKTMAAAFLMAATAAFAQNDKVEYELDLEGAEVMATRAPLPADKAVRLVQVISRKEIEAASAHTVNDLLKLAAGVDVRQRGGFGIQTDIGVNGGSADQLTVLLNGVNISNPHTGHLTVDLPVSVDDIERIEVIEGGASRVYGSQAFAGAINIVTRSEKQSNVGGHVQGGSYGTVGANAHLNLKYGKLSNRVSGGYSQSDGVDSNSDFQKYNAYWNEKYESDAFDLKAQAGVSGMKYGANTFYGTRSTTQWEEDTRYMLSLQGEYKGRVHVLPQVYWNRSYDHYVWKKSDPEGYQNYHLTNVYGANVNSYISWLLGKTALGLEYRHEGIYSTRLGKEIPEHELVSHPGYLYNDNRTNVGVYLEHDVLLKDVTISLGLLSNYNSSVKGGMRFYPGVDLSWRIIDGLKVYGSFNQSLRVPTFTDLYYYGPGLSGKADLKPEKSTDFALGASYVNNAVRAQVKGFYRIGTDMIDWVMKEGSSIYTSDNCDINNLGVEGLVGVNFPAFMGENSYLRSFTVSYCYNLQKRMNVEQASLYKTPLDFLRHKMVASLNHTIVSKLSAQWDYTLKAREGKFQNAFTDELQAYGTFGTLDLKLMWTAPRYTLYLQGNNLTCEKYYDIANVRQPGFWFMGGAKFNVNL